MPKRKYEIVPPSEEPGLKDRPTNYLMIYLQRGNWREYYVLYPLSSQRCFQSNLKKCRTQPEFQQARKLPVTL